jgi:hypothetical protein
MRRKVIQEVTWRYYQEHLLPSSLSLSETVVRVQPLNCCYVQNLCIASAYRPVQELIEEEKKVVILF